MKNAKFSISKKLMGQKSCRLHQNTQNTRISTATVNKITASARNELANSRLKAILAVLKSFFRKKYVSVPCLSVH